MQLTGITAVDTAVDTALNADARIITDVLMFDWNGTGLFDHQWSDLSGALVDSQLDRSLAGALPQNVQGITGYSTAQCTFTLEGTRSDADTMNVYQAFSEFNTASSLYQKPRAAVNMYHSEVIITNQGPVTVRQFTGLVHQVDLDRKSGKVIITCWDTTAAPQQPFTLPRWAIGGNARKNHAVFGPGDDLPGDIDPRQSPMYQNASGVIDLVLRQFGFFQSPKPHPNCVLSVNYGGTFCPDSGFGYVDNDYGSGIPAIGSSTIPNDPPPWKTAVYGTGYVNDSHVYYTMNYMLNRAINVQNPPAQGVTIGIGHWIKPISLAAGNGGVVVILGYNPAGFGSGSVQMGAYPDGRLQLVVYDGNTYNQSPFGPTITPDQWHYVAVDVTFYPGSVVYTWFVDGTSTGSVTLPAFTNVMNPYAGGPIGPGQATISPNLNKNNSVQVVFPYPVQGLQVWSYTGGSASTETWPMFPPTQNQGPELITNTGFEVNTTGWTGAGGTLTRVAGGSSGSWSGLMTPNGVATDVTVSSNPLAITPGGNYRFATKVLFTNAQTNSFTIAINWYDASLTFLSQSRTPAVSSVTAGAWQLAQGQFNAPPNAAYAAMILDLYNTPPAANTFQLDEISMRQQNFAQHKIDLSLNTLSTLPDIYQMNGFDVIKQLVGAEYGVVYTDENGYFKFLNRTSLANIKTLPIRTLTTDQLFGFQMTTAQDGVRNQYAWSATSSASWYQTVWQPPNVNALDLPRGGKLLITSVNVENAQWISTSVPGLAFLSSPDASWSQLYQGWYAIEPNNANAQFNPTSGSTTYAGYAGFAWAVYSDPNGRFGTLQLLNQSAHTLRFSTVPGTAGSGSNGIPTFSIGGMLIIPDPVQTGLVIDPVSTTTYGPKTFQLPPSPWIQDANSAAAICNSLLVDTHTPVPIAKPFEVAYDPRRQLLDTVEIVDPAQSGSRVVAVITGIKRARSLTGGRTETLQVQLSGPPGAWLLGDADYSLLGTSTNLA